MVNLDSRMTRPQPTMWRITFQLTFVTSHRCLHTPLLGAFAILCIIGCETSPPGHPDSEVIGSANLTIIRSADSNTVSLIDGGVDHDEVGGVRVNVSDYPVTQNLGELASDQVPRLLAILLDPATYEWEHAKACIVTPGVRLSFQSASDQVDILFCFQCDILFVYRDGEYVSGGSFDFGRPQLVELLKDHFPNEPLIQSLAPSP